MTVRTKPPEPAWRQLPAQPTRRRTFLGLAAYVAGGLPFANAQPGVCVLTPDSGEGPFYFDPSLVRVDIADEQAGAPLDLRLQVVRAADCAVLENARVDVWHADGIGLYSGYERQSGVGGIDTGVAAGRSYLRGTQFTNGEGAAHFRTIHPSWYRGRTPHVHFKIFLGGNEVVASQIFFPDAVNERVFNEWEPYRQHVRRRDTLNANDTFLTDRVGGVLCEAEVGEAGVRATLTVAVDTARA